MTAFTFETNIIDSVQLFEELVSYVEDSNFEYITLDTETDSAQEKLANLYGIALSFKDNEAFYIVWRDKLGRQIFNEDEIELITEWLYNQCNSKKLITHNGLYDVLVIENNLGLNLETNIYHDTILSKHLIDEERPFGLKEIAIKYIGEDANKAQEALYENIEANGGSTNKDNVQMFKADTHVLAEYAMWDVILTFKLFKIFDQKLTEQDLSDLYYKDEVLPLYKEVVINMKRKGFKIDKDHFLKLNKDITKDIDTLELDIYSSIKDEISDFETNLLNEDFPIKNSGNFPKALAAVLDIPLPINKKTGEITLAKKFILEQQKLNPKDFEFYEWVMGNRNEVPTTGVYERQAQERLFFNKFSENKHIFNLKSNDHLSYLLYEVLGIKVTERTETGKPKIDDDILDSIKHKHPFISKLSDLKKLNKLKSTYIEGVLEREINSYIYTGMLAFGTTSGRFASTSPNLNNLPALMKDKSLVAHYTNAIRKGFIAPKGYKIIGSDFSSLEPHIAAYVSDDPGLLDIFINDKDFYSAIGIKQFSIKDATPYKDDSEDSFPIKYKELRDKVKTYSLAAFYGAGPARIAQVLNCDKKEAEELLEGYFKAFPGVLNFIKNCHREVKAKGTIINKVGRIRHLLEAKVIYYKYGDKILDYRWANQRGLIQERRRYKNYLNNSVNFPIQSLAASCLNRAMINMNREFKDKNIDAHIALCVHDETLVVAKEEDIKVCCEIVKRCMENCLDLSPIKLKATPVIGNSYGECK